MPYSHKHKLIYIHVPKAAGSAINNCFSDTIDDYIFPNLKYKYNNLKGTIEQGAGVRLKNSLSEGVWNRYQKISFVRNPYDRFVSGWSYAEKITGYKTEFENFVKDLDLYRDFDTIVWHTIISQTTHLTINKKICCKIGKVENLKQDLQKLSPVKIYSIGRVNITQHKPYKEYYNKELADIIYNRFKQDFINFNYDKDSWK